MKLPFRVRVHVGVRWDVEKKIETTSCRVDRDYTGLYRPLCLKLLGCYKGIPKLSFHVIWEYRI